MNMTIRWGIKTKILALAIIPVVFIGITLTWYFVHAQFEQLTLSLKKQAHSLAIQVSTASEYAIFSGNYDHLEEIGLPKQLFRDFDQLLHIMIRDPNGQSLVSYSRDQHNDLANIPFLSGANDHYLTDSRGYIFQQPVILSQLVIDDFSTLDDDTNQMQLDNKGNLAGWVTIELSLENLIQDKNIILFQSLAITLLILSVTATFALRSGHKISSPIINITDAVKRIAQGNLSTRINLQSSGEIEILSRGINTMASAMELSHEKLQTEVDKATKELRANIVLLQEQESRYRELVENANSIILKIDLNGQIIFFNEFAEQYFGYSKDEIVGKSAVGTIVPKPLINTLTGAAESNPDYFTDQSIHITKDGREVYINWSNKPILDSKGKRVGLICIGNDITIRRQVEQGLNIISYAGSDNNNVYEDLAYAITHTMSNQWTGLARFSENHDTLEFIGQWSEHNISRDREYDISSNQCKALYDINKSQSLNADDLNSCLILRDFSVNSFLSEPIVNELNNLIGIIIVIDDKPREENPAYRALLKLTSKRAALEIQHDETTKTLAIARDGAIEAMNAKALFLANMSHEIRTPLNGMIGYTNLLNQTELTDKQKDQVSTIRRASQNLLEIINNILEISKAESGSTIIQNTGFNLYDLFEDIASLASLAAYEKDLDLVLLIDAEVPEWVLGDRQKIRQITTNLIGNAIKFTDTGNVVVHLYIKTIYEDTATIQCSIKDSGIGIQEELIPHLFQPFIQLDSSSTKRFEGTGLGLSISKMYTNQLGGEIGVSSIHKEGSNFWFSVPVLIQNNSALDTESKLSLTDLTAHIYDPTPDTTLSIEICLSKLGAKTCTYSSPEALSSNQLTDEHDIIIVGSHSGTDNHKRLLHGIKKLHQTSTCPIFALTATADQTLLTQFIEAGASCIAKPICRVQLHDVIRQVVYDNIKPSHKEPEHTTYHQHKINALVVDDNDINRSLLADLLQNIGVSSDQVSDGQASVIAANKCSYNIIFMDIHMPVMNGIDAMIEIKRNRNSPNRDTPIIALTANILANEKDELTAAGFKSIIIKPLTEEDLYHLLEKLLINKPDNRVQNMLDHTNQNTMDTSASVYDRELALKISGGNESLADEMLGMLIKELPGHKETISEAFIQAPYNPSLRDPVHKLAGAAAYCGVPALLSSAKNFERAIELKDHEDLSNRFSLLINEIEKVLDLGLPSTTPH